MPHISNVTQRALRLFLLFLCFGLIVGYHHSVPAEDSVSAVQWRMRADMTLLDFGYKEFDDAGRLLDREDGTLPGVALNLARAEGNWTLSGRFTWHAGDVLYDGQTNTGVPVRSRTDENILDSSLLIERRMRVLQDSIPLALYGGIGYRYWERDIRPTRTAAGQAVDGLSEIYRWRYVFLGGRTVLYDFGASRWQLDLRVFRPYRPTIEVDQQGRNDTVILDLGEHTGWRVSFPWEYRTGERTRLVLEPYAEGWDLGRSPTETLTRNGVPVGTVYELRSVTRNVGLNIGVQRFF